MTTSISNELLALRYLLHRENYVKYIKYVKHIALEKELALLLNLICSFYEVYPEASSITPTELAAYFQKEYGHIKDKNLYLNFIAQFETVDIQEELTKDILLALVQKQIASNIASVCLTNIDAPDPSFTDLVSKELEQLSVLDSSLTSTSPFIEASIEDLVASEIMGTGINWRLNCLNQDIGPMRGGSLGVVFARVDTGKTSFLASEMTHMAEQLGEGEVIIWVNNEERGTKVKLRIVTSSTGMTKDEISKDTAAAKQLFHERKGDRIMLYDSASVSFYDIERLLKTYKVRIMCIDQGDKLVIPGNYDKNTDRLGALYMRLRELVKTYPKLDILCAGQASAEAANQRWLRVDWMSESKTSKPAELDYAIGIGALLENEDTRYINICKNKSGNHGKFEVGIERFIGRYFD